MQLKFSLSQGPSLSIVQGDNKAISFAAPQGVNVSISTSTSNVFSDASPKLGADLDVNGKLITSSGDGNVVIDPSGTGAVIIKTDDLQLVGADDSTLTTTSLKLKHGPALLGVVDDHVILKAPTSLGGGSYSLTFPNTAPSNDKFLRTNSSGQLSFVGALTDENPTAKSSLTITEFGVLGPRLVFQKATGKFCNLELQSSHPNDLTFFLPNTAGNNGDFMKVDGSGNLGFVSPSFLTLNDTPSSFTANKFLKVNSSGNAIVLADSAGGATTTNELTDVNSSGVQNEDVLVFSSSQNKFIPSSKLNNLTQLLKNGTSTTLTSDGSGSNTAQGRLNLAAAEASLKFNVTGLVIDESSPGEIQFNVATDTNGNTEYTAVSIEGSTVANNATVTLKNGTRLRLQSASGLCTFVHTGGDISVNTPSSAGTLALTSDIASDSAVQANTAKTSFPGFGTSAGTALEGNTSLLQLGTTSTTALAGDTTTISTAQANKLAGIETGADVTDATNVASAGALMAASAQLAGNLDVQANEINTTTTNGNIKLNPNGSGCVEAMGDGTSSGTAGAIQLNCSLNTHGVKIQSPAHSQAATYTLTLPTSAGSANQTLSTDGNGVLSWVTRASSDTSLANTDQTLTGNRNIDMGSNFLTFKSGSNLRMQYDPNDDRFEFNNGLLVNGDFVTATGGLTSGLIKFNEPTQGGTNGVILRGPTTNLGSDVTFVLPDADGSAGQFLKTDGGGNLSFASAGGSGATTFLGLTDTPSSFTASKFLKVNSAGNAVEFVDGGGSGISSVLEDTAPQLGGDLDTNGKNVLFAKTANTDHSVNGDIVKFGGTNGMTQGDLYYYTSSGTWAQANASAEATSGACLLAIALGAQSDVNGMLLRGIYTMDANAIDGTEATGDELYVSAANAGHVTSAPPTAQNHVVRVIGYCLDGTNGQIWFNPSNDFIKLA